MAVYQVTTKVLPKAALVKTGKSVPCVLSETELKVDWWKDSKLKTDEVISFIESLLRKDNCYSDDFLYWKYPINGDHDHDIHLVVHEGRVGRIYIRFDLRESNANFMKQVFNWLKEIDAVICFLENKEVIEPNIKNAAPILLKTTAHKFCSDPEEFISNLKTLD